MQYQFIKFRFGRVALNYYHKVEKYVSEDLNVIFLEGGRDTSYVYGVYFSSRSDSERIDAILKSLHFERIFLPDEYDTTPTDACRTLEKNVFIRLRKKFRHIDEEIAEMLSKRQCKNLSRHKKRLQALAKKFRCAKSLPPVWKTNTITSLYYVAGCLRQISVPSSKTSSTIRTCLSSWKMTMRPISENLRRN